MASVMGRFPLLAFDFDGTLAPIVARPDDARVSTAVSHRLAQLAQWYPVAIISGRRVADVVGRLGFNPAYVVGSHGAEGLPVVPDPTLLPALASARALLAQHAARLGQVGVSIEDKGLSFALHYRLAPDRLLAEQCIEQTLAGLGPQLRAFGGKLVVNVVAADAPDKGDALQCLVEHSGSEAALFVGDDVNDEPAFSIAPAHWLTARIGRQETESQAQFCLGAHAEMPLLLQRLIDLHGERQVLAPQG